MYISSFSKFKNDLNRIEKYFESNDFFIINNSFAHFGLTIGRLNNIGWFDERFFGFGQEDGDFYYRYLEYYKNHPNKIACPSFEHLLDKARGNDYKNKSNNGTFLNDIALNLKYTFSTEATENMFGASAELKSKNIQDYIMPSERINNYDLLGESDEHKIRDRIKKLFKTDKN